MKKSFGLFFKRKHLSLSKSEVIPSTLCRLSLHDPRTNRTKESKSEPVLLINSCTTFLSWVIRSSSYDINSAFRDNPSKTSDQKMNFWTLAPPPCPTASVLGPAPPPESRTSQIVSCVNVQNAKYIVYRTLQYSGPCPWGGGIRQGGDTPNILRFKPTFYCVCGHPVYAQPPPLSAVVHIGNPQTPPFDRMFLIDDTLNRMCHFRCFAFAGWPLLYI